ncbi:MAG TPA: class I SAM-dependent methyltransferase [Polyangiaceae bacterium]
MTSPDPYDRQPYTEHAYAETHPDRLAVVALLAGWRPPAVPTARVLELGCGPGGNLLPMAAQLPGASLVGVDLSRVQIEHARAVAGETGLTNVTFHEASFDDAAAAPGPFDFVVAHGVCSWVAPAARRALLRAVAGALSSGGIAYVSFNVLPGWYDRMAPRAWLRAHPTDDPLASLAWLRDRVSPELSEYRRRLDAVARRLGETDRAYATHEYLADEHHPMFVRDLLAEATDAGLTYLGDAVPSETALEMLPDDEARGRARASDAPGAQEIVDFVRNTAFRRALFVRTDAARAAGWQWSPGLSAAAIDAMRVASRLRPHGSSAGPDARGAERFDGPESSVQVDSGVARRALHTLADAAPRSRPFGDLAGGTDAAALRAELFDLWLATGALDFHVHEPPLAGPDVLRPLACPVARWHAAHGGPITNRWHQAVRLEDPPMRAVLALLDGTRTLAEVARAAGCTDAVASACVEAIARAALLAG